MTRARALLGGGLALLIVSAALAHGDAGWIQGDPVFGWCCGKEDCAPLPPGAVARVPGGWVIVATGQVFRRGERGLYSSIDAQYWACRTPGAPTVHCLFVPTEGA